MTQSNRTPVLRVLQLTDPHLMADPSGALLGVNTRDSLDAVITRAQQEYPSPNLILATGDLAQDGSEEAYRVFQEKLSAFPCGSAWLAGNHDNAAMLERVTKGTPAARRHFIQGGWQFILLDSSVPGEVYGELPVDELDFLEQTLEQHPDLPALVTLHHHPVRIGSDWMEPIGLRNREAFWQVIDRFPQVKIVLWGHIHQELDQERNGVRLLATPSTCIQFAAGSSDFAVEGKAPGYRWLNLYPSGDFETGVSRATDFEFDLDSNSTGY